MSDNPYNPVWIAIDDDHENFIWEGMRVRLQEGMDEGIVLSSTTADGDMDEGRMVYYPPKITVRFLDGDEDTFRFEDLEVLEHELEDGKRRWRKYLERIQKLIPVDKADFAPKG
jgi:hypothetical protein